MSSDQCGDSGFIFGNLGSHIMKVFNNISLQGLDLKQASFHMLIRTDCSYPKPHQYSSSHKYRKNTFFAKKVSEDSDSQNLTFPGQRMLNLLIFDQGVKTLLRCHLMKRIQSEMCLIMLTNYFFTNYMFNLF